MENWTGTLTVQDVTNILIQMEKGLVAGFPNQGQLEAYQQLRNKLLQGLQTKPEPPKEG